jgi:hypothetical protein
MALPTFSAGNRITAANLTALTTALTNLTPVHARKPTDESVSSGTTGTTMQDDNDLFVALRANTSYEIDLDLLYNEATGTGIDLKAGWSFPTGCTLDLADAGAHVNWTGVASALEVEWAAWQNITTSPSATITFGSNTSVFSMRAHGRINVGSTSGNLQFRWAQNTSAVGNLTVKAGSLLIAKPLSL